jgi:rod shape-determining protein MreD
VGACAWLPDLLALVLVFWSVHQPLRVGVGAAFVFGLLMDVHQAALLGQHALAYTGAELSCHHHPPPAAVVPVPCRPCRCCRCSWRAHAIELAIRMLGRRRLSGLVGAAGAAARVAAVAGGQRAAADAAAPRADPDENRPL